MSDAYGVRAADLAAVLLARVRRDDRGNPRWEALARDAGVATRTLTRITAGMYEHASLGTADAILTALGETHALHDGRCPVVRRKDDPLPATRPARPGPAITAALLGAELRNEQAAHAATRQRVGALKRAQTQAKAAAQARRRDRRAVAGLGLREAHLKQDLAAVRAELRACKAELRTALAALAKR